MARFTSAGGGSGSGAPGPRGQQGVPGQPGANGEDALWNYLGEYDGGSSYAVGDVVTYDGELWYRFNANGGNVGDTPSPGLWNLLAAKGEDGTNASGGLVYLGNYILGNGYIADIAVVRGSDNNLYIAKSSGGLADPVGNTAEWDIFSDNTAVSADIADFVFSTVEEPDYESTMTVTNNDMIIKTVVNTEASGNIMVDSAQDIILIANGDAYIGDNIAQVNRIATIGDITSANIANFVFESGGEDGSVIKTNNDEASILIQGNEDVTIHAIDDDVRLWAEDDIRIVANYGSDNEQYWRFNDQGDFELPKNAQIRTVYTNVDNTGTRSNTFTTNADGATGGVTTAALNVPLDEFSSWYWNNNLNITSGSITLADSTVVQLGDGIAFASGGNIGDVEAVFFFLSETVTRDISEIYPFTVNVSYDLGTTQRTSLIIETDYPEAEGNAEDHATFILGKNGAYFNTEEQGNRFATISDLEAANTADFVFNYDEEESDSTMTIHNHDMVIKTTRDNDEDADISINSADDIWINATDDIEIFAENSIYLHGTNGVYLSTAEEDVPNPDNQVATIGDIQAAGTGDITFVESTISNNTGDDIVIENKNDDGIVKARITLDQSNEQVLIEAMSTDSEWFNDSQWADATWSGNTVTINNTPDIINFFNNINGDMTSVSINDGTPVEYDGAGYGPENININVIGTPSEDPLTVTTIRFYYSQSSRINIDNDDNEFDIISMNMSINIDSSGDLQLTARDEDIDLNARDDIRFTANWDTEGDPAEWRMTNSGRFELPGDGYIENVRDSSSDNGSSDTIKIVPDSNLLDNSIFNVDQYIVIDPTGPNHIHVRSGGTIDESTADLILGGERNKVQISDSERTVAITTRPPSIINTYLNTNPESSTIFFTGSTADIQNNYTVNVGGTDYIVDSVNSVDEGVIGVTANGAVFNTAQNYTFTFEPFWDNNWTFGSDGVFSGPAMGGVKVPAIANSVDGNDLYVYATGANVNIEANDGAVNIASPEININSNAVPSSLNINTYSGAVINSARTSTYDAEDKVVATLGDVEAARFGASASYHSRVTQGPQLSANTVQPFTFSSTDWETGILRVDNTKIKMLSAGKYNIAFSAQLVQGNNAGTLNIWLNKNGTPMAYTNTKVTIESNATYTVAAWNFFVDAATDDYYELIWSSSSTNTTIQYDTAQTINGNVHPEIPSIILTVNQVG